MQDHDDLREWPRRRNLNIGPGYLAEGYSNPVTAPLANAANLFLSHESN